mgnify:CR=1 FL=1
MTDFTFNHFNFDFGLKKKNSQTEANSQAHKEALHSAWRYVMTAKP